MKYSIIKVAQDLEQGANEVIDTETIQEEPLNNSVSEEGDSGLPIVEEAAPAIEEITEAKTLPKESAKHSVGSDVNYEWAGFTKKGKIIEDLGTKVKIKSSDGVTHRVDKAALNGLPKKSEKLIADLEEIVNPKKAKKSAESKNPSISDGQVVANDILAPVRALTAGFNKMQEKTVGRFFKNVEDATAKLVNKGLASRNVALNKAVGILKNLMGGLAFTHSDIKNKLEFTGGKNYAHLKATMLADELYAIVDKDPESLKRVHAILDPEVYTGTPEEKLSFSDLTGPEQELFQLIRKSNDFIHEWHKDHGLIDQATYDKFKGKYIARLYEDFEIAPEETSSLFSKSRAEFGMFKKRKDAENVESKILSDPVFATAKRFSQMLSNQAIFDYADAVSDSKTFKISNTEFPGSSQLGKPGDKPFYGSLTGKFVPNHVFEDFRGFFFANRLAQGFYEAFKAYDKLALRQFLKKSKTVFNPVVQLGNAASNFSFAWWAGISPDVFAKNIIKAVGEIKAKGEIYQDLVKAGIIGSDVITQDLIKPKSTGAYAKFDKIASSLYQGSDDTAKIAAYLSFKDDYKYSKEEAIKQTYENFQNYATVGKTYDLASKTPLIGNAFIKFKADLLRIKKNAITRRPLTYIAYLGLLKVIASWLSEASGEDEELKKARERRPFTPKVQTPFGDISLMMQVPGLGEVNTARFIAPDYVYDMGDQEDRIASFTSYLPYQVKQSGSSPSKDISNLQPDFADVLTGPLAQTLILDRDFRGKSIRDPKGSKFITAATPEEQILNSLNYNARSYVPMFRSGQDLINSYNGNPDFYDRERTVVQSVLNNIIKVQEFGKDQVIDQLEGEIKYKVAQFEGLTRDVAQLKSVARKEIGKIQQRTNQSEEHKKSAIDDEVKKLNDRILRKLQKQNEIIKELEEPAKILKLIE